jgi:hypothetical protein
MWKMRKDLEYVEKTENHGKREIHGRTWNMVRNAKNVGNEKCTL